MGGFNQLYLRMPSILEKTPSLHQEILDKKESLLKDWKATSDKAIIEGSKEHDLREQHIYENGFIYKDKHYEYKEGKNILTVNTEDTIVIPECLIWNHERKWGGLADIFLFDKGIMHILDYKTNASIDKDQPNLPPQYKTYMKDICSNYLDLNYYHYSLQLNIYQRMGLMLRKEFKKGDNVIIHTASETHNRKKDNYMNVVKQNEVNIY